MKTRFAFLAASLSALFAIPIMAQFNIDGQIVQRTEYRNGYNLLIEEKEDPAVFIAHRARLQAAYKFEKLHFYMSVQDVRTWGSTQQAKANDPFFSVHEAWAETWLTDRLSLKLGRQELNYDNFRFLGNLDWALQARAHDFALVKFEKDNLKLHLGGGYNQDAQKLSGNTFTVPNQYKVAQMLRYENLLGKLQFSLLFWNDGRQYFDLDTSGVIVGQGVRYRQTIGIPTLKLTLGNTTPAGFFYFQTGKDVWGNTVEAFDACLQVTQQIDLNKEKSQRLRIVAGAEVLSGTTPGDDKNRSFSPQYGTNHLFNGYMDLFFVGGSFENNAGLTDLFLRARCDFGPRWFVQADGHRFYSHARGRDPVSGDLDKYLGTEADLSVGFLINNAVSLQCGFSHLFAGDSFGVLTQVSKPKDIQQWGYAMLIYRPTMKNKFIGILL